jgi:hypothetical protein
MRTLERPIGDASSDPHWTSGLVVGNDEDEDAEDLLSQEYSPRNCLATRCTASKINTHTGAGELSTRL